MAQDYNQTTGPDVQLKGCGPAEGALHWPAQAS